MTPVDLCELSRRLKFFIYPQTDALLKKSPSNDSLYDKSESSSPVPPSEGSGKIF